SVHLPTLVGASPHTRSHANHETLRDTPRRDMAAPQPRLAVLTAAIFLSIPLAQAQPAAGRATTGTPSKAPVVLILLENHAYGQIVGSRGAPYLNSRFIPAGTLFTRYFAVAH